MEIVKGLVTSVRQFYNDINPATLTGAIDVIVVEKPNGELASTPFHVRFGKINVMNFVGKTVEIYINDEATDLRMKLGPSGEAFFVEASDQEPPPRLATSPLPDPTVASNSADSFVQTSSSGTRQTLLITDSELNHIESASRKRSDSSPAVVDHGSFRIHGGDTTPGVTELLSRNDLAAKETSTSNSTFDAAKTHSINESVCGSGNSCDSACVNADALNTRVSLGIPGSGACKEDNVTVGIIEPSLHSFRKPVLSSLTRNMSEQVLSKHIPSKSLQQEQSAQLQVNSNFASTFTRTKRKRKKISKAVAATVVVQHEKITSEATESGEVSSSDAEDTQFIMDSVLDEIVDGRMVSHFEVNHAPDEVGVRPRAGSAMTTNPVSVLNIEAMASASQGECQKVESSTGETVYKNDDEDDGAFSLLSVSLEMKTARTTQPINLSPSSGLVGISDANRVLNGVDDKLEVLLSSVDHPTAGVESAISPSVRVHPSGLERSMEPAENNTSNTTVTSDDEFNWASVASGVAPARLAPAASLGMIPAGRGLENFTVKSCSGRTFGYPGSGSDGALAARTHGTFSRQCVPNGGSPADTNEEQRHRLDLYFENPSTLWPSISPAKSDSVFELATVGSNLHQSCQRRQQQEIFRSDVTVCDEDCYDPADAEVASVKWSWGELPEGEIPPQVGCISPLSIIQASDSHRLAINQVISAPPLPQLLAADLNRSGCTASSVDSTHKRLNCVTTDNVAATLLGSSELSSGGTNDRQSCRGGGRDESAKFTQPATVGLTGLYLDDVLAQTDPAMRARYIGSCPRRIVPPPQATNDGGGRSRVHPDADGGESGNGPSLSQSPQSGLDSDCEPEIRHPIFDYRLRNYSDLAMSLCGFDQIKEDDPVDGLFVAHLVTYDDFVQNTDLLDEPNLVFRMNGKYYNWKTLAPQLLSLAMFQTPLPTHTVEKLSSEHMPKKKTSNPTQPAKSRGWWWSRGPASNSENTSSMAVSIKEHSNAGLKDSVVSNHKENSVSSGSDKETEKEATTMLDTFEKNTLTEEELLATQLLQEEMKKPHNKKSLRLSSNQLKSLGLKPGSNLAEFKVITAYQGTSVCSCRIYLWKSTDRIVVSDIDGTITKSDVLGHILPMIGRDWAQSGVASLFNKIHANGYRLIYLSARAIGQAQWTRDFLRTIKQDALCLPDGPVLLNPTSLLSALHREVVAKNPHIFKINCLRDVRQLFSAPDGAPGRPFYAGFGNKTTDALSYKAVSVPVNRIFTINPRGVVSQELMGNVGQTYHCLSDIADHIFPPILHTNADSGQAREQFSSFAYWKDPIPSIGMEQAANASLYLTNTTSAASHDSVGSVASSSTKKISANSPNNVKN